MTSALADPLTGARLRTVRVLSIGFGVAAVVFVALAIPAIQDQMPMLQPWYPVLAFAVTPILPAALGILSFWLSKPGIRAIAGCSALGYLVVLAAWMPAMTVAALPQGQSPWVLGYVAIPTAAAAIAWPAGVAWAYLAISSAAVGLLRFLASGQTELERALQDTLYAGMFSAIFTALAMALMRASGRLDDAATGARAETASAAATAARERQRARIDGLMHDSVFTTLLVAAQSVLPARDLAAHATATLQQLDRMKTEDDPRVRIDAADFAALQTATIRSIAPDAAISVELADAAAPRGDAALALGEALTEALRNSVRHAPDARRSVQLTATEHGVRIIVDDDGPGFDPGAVPSSRLGLAVSIMERMQSVRGGSASVRSSRARGTRIVLQWINQ